MNITKIKNDQSGIIFVTVLVIIIVMMVVTVSIISMNVSQVSVTEKDTRRIQAEILAQGTVDYITAHKVFNGLSDDYYDFYTGPNGDYHATAGVSTNTLITGYGSNVLDINIIY